MGLTLIDILVLFLLDVAKPVVPGLLDLDSERCPHLFGHCQANLQKSEQIS